MGKKGEDTSQHSSINIEEYLKKRENLPDEEDDDEDNDEDEDDEDDEDDEEDEEELPKKDVNKGQATQAKAPVIQGKPPIKPAEKSK